MSNCSLVIRCYNEERHIEKLLKGVLKQTITDVEIILVDSGSTDATVSIASRFPVKILSIPQSEFSFGRALNLGCGAAVGEFIVMASAHVYPLYPDWLEKLLAPFTDAQVALVYGKQQGNEITKYSESQIFAKWFPEQSHLEEKEHPFCNNANSAIRRCLWQNLPYDETLTGLEDLDWAARAQKLGYKIFYAADAPIVHIHHESPERIYNRYRREAIALKKIFPQEHFHLWDFIRLFLGNLVSDYYHAWHDGLLSAKAGEIFLFRLIQFWGTYRGFSRVGTVSSKLKQTFYYPKGFVRSQSSLKPEGSPPIDYAALKQEASVE